MTMQVSSSPTTRLINEDYPPPEAGTFDKERHQLTAACRLRAGYQTTKDARSDYIKNCADSLKANEVFMLQGSN